MHRRCSRVVGKSKHGHVPQIDPNNSFDHTNVDLFRFQDSALFDVQFQIGENFRTLSFGCLQIVRIATDEANSFSDRLSTVTLYQKRFLTEFANRGTASGKSTFFIAKYDDL